jgi:hypothetical protein
MPVFDTFHFTTFVKAHIGTSCTFYVESIQVEHSRELGRKHRKKERVIMDWGERERTYMVERERRGF